MMLGSAGDTPPGGKGWFVGPRRDTPAEGVRNPRPFTAGVSAQRYWSPVMDTKPMNWADIP